MADFSFWQNLAEEFRALPENGTFVYRVIEGLPGSIPPPSDRWHLFSNSVHIAQKFELLARRGGSELSSNAAIDSFQAWMEALHVYGVNLDTEEKTFTGHPEIVIQVRRKIIHPAEASTLFCGDQAIRAFETERLRRAEEAAQNDPRNWSALRQHIEATQAMKAVMTAQPFDIKEEFVRNAVALHEGIRPEDVTWERIKWEVAGLLPQYPRIRLIPSKPLEFGNAETGTTADTETPTNPCVRGAEVDEFLRQCNAISVPRIYRKHIWQSVGHSKPRQFEYWQACDAEHSTGEDERNFNRVLRAKPEDFISQLERQGLIKKNP